MLTKINVGMCTSNEDGSVTINYSDGGSVTYLEKDGEMKTPTAFNWTAEMEAIWPRDMRPTASGLLAIWEALHGAAVYADAPAPSIAPDTDGWTEWHGGECPVDPETMVEVRYEGQAQGYKLRANRVDWSSYAILEVSHYRVVTPAADDGWIAHKAGDPCPVPGRLYVEVKFAAGGTGTAQASSLYWEADGIGRITHWRRLP